MTLYEVEVRYRVAVTEEDEDTAKSKARSLVAAGAARCLGTEIVGYVKPAAEPEEPDAAA